MKSRTPYILMLEDDDDDRVITKNFFAAHNYNFGLEFLMESEDVMPYLEVRNKNNNLLPSLILLDKNVPAGGGMDVLRDLKSHPLFRMIPVVMISGGAHPDEINESYSLGVNSFILKPFSNNHTSDVIGNFLKYWFHSVELPNLNMSATNIPT